MKPCNRLQILSALLVLTAGQWGYSQKADSIAPSDSLALATNPTAPAKVTQDTVLSDSAKKAFVLNAALGKQLFEGNVSFINGGPNCISCHNVTAPGVTPGGLLAKDLTHVFARLGEAGLPPILNSTPFPAMATAYRNKPLDPTEVIALTAFFKDVEQTVAPSEPAPDHTLLLAGGGLGILVWFGLIGAIWFKRKKTSVKKDIYDRQIR